MIIRVEEILLGIKGTPERLTFLLCVTWFVSGDGVWRVGDPF
jgi:hypothetical protein